MNYELPKLPYEYNALEPVIDARTMELHHSKHHAAYITKLNEALKQFATSIESSEDRVILNKTLEEMLGDLDNLPTSIRTAIRNHGGGHYNHSLFWQMLRPARENNSPEGVLLGKITEIFGDFNSFKEKFSAQAVGFFGSGWVWFALQEATDEYLITTTTNQDTLIMQGLTPILGLDVWEHAYYLNYQNRRAEYIAAWWSIVNWDFVATKI